MKVFILMLFAALLAVGTFAQTTSRSGAFGGVIGPASSAPLAAPGWTFTTASVGMAGGTVTGAPFSAEEITEHVQTLADGTHIRQPAPKVKYYRDSQGRTRTEHTFVPPPGASATAIDLPTFIEIFDPVSGGRYTLEPRNHTARRISFAIAPPPPPPPPPPNAGTAAPRRAIQILPALAPTAPLFVQGGQPQGPQISQESLGTQTIEGVLAVGSRSTTVFPIDSIGNDRPITAVSETWVSPELKMVVLSKNSDPRNGDSTTRLTNISRSEPDMSLFEIPPDYEVIDPQVAVQKP